MSEVHAAIPDRGSKHIINGISVERVAARYQIDTHLGPYIGGPKIWATTFIACLTGVELEWVKLPEGT